MKWRPGNLSGQTATPAVRPLARQGEAGEELREKNERETRVCSFQSRENDARCSSVHVGRVAVVRS